MTFERIENDPENGYFFQHRNRESGLTICLWSVLYGTRVRVYFADSAFCILDYCGGNNQTDVMKLYYMVLNIIGPMTVEEFNRFRWPVQHYRPICNDPECFAQLYDLAGDNPFNRTVDQPFPDVNLIRLISLSNLYHASSKNIGR